jgi:hypothetical protein
MYSLLRLSVLVVLVAFSGDLFSQRVVRTDSRPKPDPVRPEVILFHSSTEQSEVHFRISSRDIVYTKGDSGESTASLQINYRVFPIEGVKHAVDSGTINLSDTKSDVWEKFISGNFKVKMPAGATYTVKMQFIGKQIKRIWLADRIFFCDQPVTLTAHLTSRSEKFLSNRRQWHQLKYL